MNNTFNIQYNLTINSNDFIEFVEEILKHPTNETIALKNDIISCCSGLLEKPTSKLFDVVVLNQDFWNLRDIPLLSL